MRRRVEPPVIRGMKKICQFFDGASESTIRRWEQNGLPLYRKPHLMAIREELLAWMRNQEQREKGERK